MNKYSADVPLVFDPNEKFIVASEERHVAPPRKQPSTRSDTSVTEAAASKPVVQRAQITERSSTPEPTPQEAARQLANGVIEREQPDLNEQIPVALSTRKVPVASKVHRLPLTIDFDRRCTVAHEDISLPSEFVAYEWKDLQIRRFNIEEIRSIVRARTTGNLRHLVRAVDATLTHPVTDLTQGDFWYIMYWHRINSYKKSPFVLEWTCVDKDHLDRIGTGELKPETLKNVLTINKSNLETTYIDKGAYVAKADDIDRDYEVGVQPQMVVDFIAALEEDEEREFVAQRDKERASKEVGAAIEAADVDKFLEQSENVESLGEDEDTAFMYRYAALMASGGTLKERVEQLNGQDPDLLTDLEAFLSVADHGVKESWKVTCKECSASKTIEQSLDALMFLPSLHRGGLA